MNETIEAIKNNNMIFISAQPDLPYFHWQVSLYLYQFSKHNIQKNCYAIFGYVSRPSQYILKLSKKYNIKYYRDDRVEKNYIPSIRPHLLKKFFDQHKNLDKKVFYHDSDIFLVNLPKFELMLNDNFGYLSDTVSYIGYNYIKDKSDEYVAKYSISKDELINNMCKIVGIDPDIVKNNNMNSGGAQYLLKNVSAKFWGEVEIKCEKLYSYLTEFDSKYKLDNPIQKWCADMWVVLWVYWKYNNNTRIHPELNFSWATGTIEDYNNNNIFHLAGVTEKESSTMFYKGKYTDSLVFDDYIDNKDLFDYIDTNNATKAYADVIKEYVDHTYDRNYIVKQRGKYKTKSIIIQIFGENHYFIKNETITCCDKCIYVSTSNKYIIFYNSKVWILTHKQFMDEINKDSGGIAHTNNIHTDEWNDSNILTIS